MKYACKLCDYVYDPELGDPDGDIAPGVEFKDLPDDWVCPLCGATKDDFEPIEEVSKKEEIKSKKLFKCAVCGYIHEGEEAPDTCPKCGAPKEKFDELNKEAADKIYASDRTNDIHMEIIALASTIQELCLEGIELDLDPPCVKVFQDALNESWVIKQRSKAELAGHVGKGKW